jgi:hypothetical protein
MRGANILTGIAVVAWLSVSAIGMSLLQGLADQQVPGYPSSTHFVVIPLIVAALLLACAWLCNRFARLPALLGCLSVASVFAALIYLLGFSGGV